MRGATRYLLLVLVGLMVGAAIPVPGPTGPSAQDLGNPSDGDLIVTSATEDGVGLAYTAHVATSSDVADLMEAQGVFDPGTDYNVVIDGLGTGLAPPTLEEYAAMVGDARIVDGVEVSPGGDLPAAVDHSKEPYFPVADTQGGQGSCAAWACSYYTNGYLQARDHNWTEAYSGTNKSQLMSPAWVYNKINYGYDSGSNWYRNHALISSVGNSDWENMPYDWRDLTGWGDEDAWRIAPRYRVQGTYDLAATSSTMVIKAWLAEGWVLPMAFDAYQYSHLSDDDIISSVEYNSNAANHANTIVGYNDSITADGEAGAFKIVNSWGKTWSTDGYWWMTYDALKELWWPVMRMHDMVDYEPTLLGTLDQSTAGSKDCPIAFGTTSGKYAERKPSWWAGTRPYPDFMALDITELVEDVSLADYYLTFGSGTTTATISAFEVEWYVGGYVEGTPDKTVTSGDTPKTAPATMYAAFSGHHIDRTRPDDGTWHRAVATLNGTATESIPRLALREDFEGRWTSVWTSEDVDTAGGEDTWGVSLARKKAGDKSAWAAGSDGGVVLYEGFDADGAMPTGWATTSTGPDKYPFVPVNSGYQGCLGSDYLVVARSDRGAGTNMTELLYTSTPANASSFKDLALRFYIEYDALGGDEHVKVMVAKGSDYPTWTTMATYTADTFGYRSIDLASYDGEASLYIGFEYHGTADMHVTLDDVLLAGAKGTYDPHMRADLYIDAGDLFKYTNATLEYSYWVDSERDVDELHVMYRSSSSSSWVYLANHSGAVKAWATNVVEVPQNASDVGFRFQSDGQNQSEGVYIDDVVLMGHVAIASVEVSVDGGAWDDGTARGADWSYEWNTSSLSDGWHDLVARVNYSGAYDQVSLSLRTDNTPPTVLGQWNDTMTTGEPTALHVSAEDVNTVEAVRLELAINRRPGGELNATSTDNLTWDVPLDVPSDAVDIEYRFRLTDTIGNEVTTDWERVMVIDNDDPLLGPDRTPATATTGDELTFRTNATDNVLVATIGLEYWYGDDGAHANVTLPGTDFAHTISVDHTLDPIHYLFTVIDSSGNRLSGPMADVTVLDDDVPVFGTDHTPGVATTGETVVLTIDVEDNIALDDVRVEYSFEGGEAHNISMDGTSGAWSLTIGVPRGSLAPLSYRFYARDSSGNWDRTAQATVHILDNDLPEILGDDTPDNATTGDVLTFRVAAADNIAVRAVWVEYWYGQRAHADVDLGHREGTGWAVDVTVEHTYLPLMYIVHVRDSSGNLNLSAERLVGVVDDDEPVFVADGSPGSTTTGVRYMFSVDVDDNLGVSNVTLTYRFDGGQPTPVRMEGGDLDDNGNGTYTVVIDIPDGSTDPLWYTVRALDGAGNANVTVERSVEVLDVTLPVAVAGADVVIDQHEQVAFDGTSSTDNVAVESWRWTVAPGDAVLEGPEPTLVLHNAGTYTVTLTVYDPSGNERSDSLEVTVNDITPPTPDAGPDRAIDQFQTVYLDGTRCTDNVGIAGLTWTFAYDGSERVLSGLEPSFKFDTPGVYEVTLGVEDRAGNTNTTTMTVTVRDIIDPVAKTLGDLEGEKDAPITFLGTRCSDNVGIVNWTWTVEYASGSVVEVYGEVVSYTFDEPGDHRVTLTVTDADGNTVTSKPFTVHVPNTLLWLTLLAIIIASVCVTAGLAANHRRRMRRLERGG